MTRHDTEIPQQDNAPPDIEAFVRMVFDYCEGFVAIRLLRETGTEEGKPVSRYLKVDDDLTKRIAGLVDPAAADQRGLYAVPCTTRETGNAKAANIHETCVIPVDLDTGDINAKSAHLEHHLGPATMAVASGGKTDDGQDKLHLYWQLSEAASGNDLKDVQRLRELLIAAVDADASFARLTQPIRVPGSIHGKHNIRTPVRILSATLRDYELDALLERAAEMPRLSSLPPRPDTNYAGKRKFPVSDLQQQRVRAGSQDRVNRFEAMSSVIGHWVRLARLGEISHDEARAAVADHNRAMLDPPWPDDRVAREFNAILRKDRENTLNAGRLAAGTESTVTGTDSPPLRSEDALAEAFVARHGANWRHVAPWGRWLRWTGQFWSADETQRVYDDIRMVCRREAQNLTVREARRIASAKTISAVERIASSDLRIAKGPSDWDRHPTLLNTPGGTIDLATGEIRDHDSAQLITQVTRANPAQRCPVWLTFLDDITNGDAELQSYLARICGYCLSGDTSEQVFFFFHGAGANGKSVFLQAVARALGSYAATAPLDSFMVGRSGTHPTDLAGMRGKRLVTVSETEPGRAWAESRIKTITGGDPISARFMYRDFFEFVPTLKLIVAGNHRPQLTGVGEAMRRRLHLVPFTVTIPNDRRDKTLSTRLDIERDGILGWMIDGHRDWQDKGLAPPKAISDASEAYFGDEDLTGQWIEECCDVQRHVFAPARFLFESWAAWAEANGADRGSQKSLGEALRSRGYIAGRNRSGRFWQGLAPRGAAAGKRP